MEQAKRQYQEALFIDPKNETALEEMKLITRFHNELKDHKKV